LRITGNYRGDDGQNYIENELHLRFLPKNRTAQEKKAEGPSDQEIALEIRRKSPEDIIGCRQGPDNNLVKGVGKSQTGQASAKGQKHGPGPQTETLPE